MGHDAHACRKARFQIVVVECHGGIANAEHAIAFAHAAVDFKVIHVAFALKRLKRRGEMALIGPKLQHVAFMQLGLGLHGNLAALRLRNASGENATVVRAAIAHDVVSAAAGKIGFGESAAKGLGKRAMLFLGRARFFKRHAFVDGACQAVNCRAIGRHHGEYVFGRFHAALDFQAVDARFRELGEHVDGAEVFRGKQAVARCRKFCVGVFVA